MRSTWVPVLDALADGTVGTVPRLTDVADEPATVERIDLVVLNAGVDGPRDELRDLVAVVLLLLLLLLLRDAAGVLYEGDTGDIRLVFLVGVADPPVVLVAIKQLPVAL